MTVSPMGDECSLIADEQIRFLTYILELYEKSWDKVICIIGYNISVNRAISTKTRVRLIGCASHRFNPAVRDYLSDDKYLLTKVNELIVKLRTLLLGARLRRFTPIQPKLRNATRWSSNFEMISRYCELREFYACLIHPRLMTCP